ncbi:hypothetical protein B0H11DRAFT_2142406 [Mycena galericulata]|nr:hypothetical protein B0H11DRAFT_2142406 [Mycena galericulata]
MNSAQYATAITNELRDHAYAWLDGLRWRLELQLVLNIPALHAVYPFPVGFPLQPFSLVEEFAWTHEYDQDELRHVHRVEFVLRGRTNGAGSSVAWAVVTTGTPPASSLRTLSLLQAIHNCVLFAGNISLGVFEIAGPIYDDPALPFSIDAALVLEAILASLRLREPVHLRSRPITAAVPFRVFELRTASGILVREVGWRW